jgi:flagellar protein FliO/FliZ
LKLSKKFSRNKPDAATKRMGTGRAWVAGVSAGLALVSQVQVASAAAPDAAPFGNPLVTVMELILSLGLIIVLVVGLIRWLAKRTQVEQRGAIVVLAARQLAPNKSIQVVDVHGRTLVLGVGDDVTLLADLSKDPAVLNSLRAQDNAAQPSQSFGAILAESLQALRERHKGAQSEERTL